jgi:hypothetical protein
MLIMSSTAQVTNGQQHAKQQKLNSLTTWPSIILPHQWLELS